MVTSMSSKVILLGKGGSSLAAASCDGCLDAFAINRLGGVASGGDAHPHGTQELEHIFESFVDVLASLNTPDQLGPLRFQARDREPVATRPVGPKKGDAAAKYDARRFLVIASIRNAASQIKPLMRPHRMQQDFRGERDVPEALGQIYFPRTRGVYCQSRRIE